MYAVRFFSEAEDAEAYINNMVEDGWILVSVQPGARTPTNYDGDVITTLGGLYVVMKLEQ